jgi:hypothetical protein
MSQTDETTDATADELTSGEPATNTVPVTALLDQQGTIPYLGFTDQDQSGYPEPVDAVGSRFDQSDPLSFKGAIDCLPNAGEGTLWAENEFVTTTGGDVEIDVGAIRDVRGLDVDEVEATTGQPLNQLADAADPDPLVRVADHKDIVDRRRLALRALGFQVKFRWQIASDSYDPGDMQEFLTRKVAACQKQGIEDVFGWIRFYDWGGAAQVVSIYPDLSYEVSRSAKPESDDEQDAVDEWLEDVDDEDDDTEAEDTITVYYGDRIGYGFRGTQTIWSYPVVYVPAVDVMTPLPQPRYKRRHVGNIMDDANERANNRVPIIEWHESVLSKLEKLATKINDEIRHARRRFVDFGRLPFTVDEFYTLLGIPHNYADEAADRATALGSSTGFSCPDSDCSSSFNNQKQLQMHFVSVHEEDLGAVNEALDSHHFPHPKPSLWNLQLSLKLALLENFNGAHASSTYQEYQEVAGQILRFPGQQLELAIEEYERQRDDDDESAETLLAEDQQTLADSVDDISELPAVGTEEDISDREAQDISRRVQRRLGDSS